MTLLYFLVVLSLQLDHGLQWDPANKCFTEVNIKKNIDQQRDQQNDGEMKKSKHFKLNIIIIIIIILHCYQKKFGDLIG